MKIKEAEKLALQLMNKWDLIPLWSFGFDRSKKRFGVCKPSKKEITLSKKLVKMNNIKHVKNTILHEIAHALDWGEKGKTGHGPNWKKWAIKVGAVPTACYKSKEVNQPSYKYFDYCPYCKKTRGRHRKRSKNNLVASCNICCDTFNPDYIVIFNIPIEKKDEIKNGDIKWQNLEQTKKTIQKVKKKISRKRWEKSLFYNNLNKE